MCYVFLFCFLFLFFLIQSPTAADLISYTYL